jgi:arylsulfatase A-like enzyme
MNRRLLNSKILFYGLTFLGATTAITTRAASLSENSDLHISLEEKKVAKRPNVLFIAVDDLKPNLGCYGDEFAITPNIDLLAKKGTVFANNHCQWAVCGPTRASLLTGMRPEQTGIYNFSLKMRDVHPDILTLPEYFKLNGYETIAKGKIFDPRCVKGGRRHDEPQSWSIPYKPIYGKFKNKDHTVILTPDIEDTMLTDGLFAKFGVEFIEQYSNKKKPFFIAIGFKKPHLPFVAPKKYWDMYDASKIKLAIYQQPAKGVNPIHNYHNSNELRSYNGVPKEGVISPELQRKLIHGYYACITFIDAQIGKLLKELKARNLEDNTIVCIWGDHGWHLGDHALWGKHTSLEQATRAPLIIYAPGFKGNKSNSPTEFIDVFPTLCELVGLPIPNHLNGKSLVPIMKNPNYMVKSGAISNFSRKGFGYSYRDKRYRYVEWIDQQTKKIIDKELYDYKNDPNETVDYSKDPSYQKIMKKLSKDLREVGKDGAKLLFEVK